MCGRFTMRADGDALRVHFQAGAPPPVAARFNVAPAQAIPVVRWDPVARRREWVMQRWGFVPGWARRGTAAPAAASGFINARAETLAAKPAFRDAFRHRRCLIPADGFYEWAENGGGRKQPWFIHRAGHALFAFAGVWEPGGETAAAGCAVVTRAPLPLVATIHDRMPAIVNAADYETWLEADGNDLGPLNAVLARAAPDDLEMSPVGRAVNRAGYDAPECVQPAAADAERLF